MVIVGGGIAGASAAFGARAADAAADITLLCAEDCSPYDRTVLSKDALLTGAAAAEQPVFAPALYLEQSIRLLLGTRVAAIDVERQRVVTDAGASYGYDALVLATGSTPRALAGLDDGAVLYLRTHRDAAALYPRLKRAGRAIVIGAGLIGLEVAAAARVHGVEVDVIEAADGILGRACDRHTADSIERHHRSAGVRFHTGCRITGIERSVAGAARVSTADRGDFDADLLVAGIGVSANAALAAAAGIAVDDGIVVDRFGRASAAGVYAAGDVARLPLSFAVQPARLETWRHAQDHGRLVGRNAAGEATAYDAVPIFWSDQYDHRIQGAGLPSRAHELIVRRYHDGSHACFLLDKERRMRAAVGIDRSQDINGARRLIAAQAPMDGELLADPAVPVPRLVKQLTNAEERRP